MKHVEVRPRGFFLHNTRLKSVVGVTFRSAYSCGTCPLYLFHMMPVGLYLWNWPPVSISYGAGRLIPVELAPCIYFIECRSAYSCGTSPLYLFHRMPVGLFLWN